MKGGGGSEGKLGLKRKRERVSEGESDSCDSAAPFEEGRKGAGEGGGRGFDVDGFACVSPPIIHRIGFKPGLTCQRRPLVTDGLTRPPSSPPTTTAAPPTPEASAPC